MHTKQVFARNLQLTTFLAAGWCFFMFFGVFFVFFMVVLGTNASCGTKEALFLNIFVFEYFWHSLFLRRFLAEFFFFSLMHDVPSSSTMGETHTWEMWDVGCWVRMSWHEHVQM